MATKTGIDQDALIEQFAQAGAKQAAALRQAVSEATLQALQGRELTLQNVRKVLKTVTEAASAGAARNAAPPAQVETLLASAVDGMDAALLQAVEAHRRALQQFIDQGVGLQQGAVKQALGEIEKLEEVLVASVTKVAQSAGAPLEGPWTQVLESMKLQGTDTGTQAHAAVEQLMRQGQAAMRDGRAIGLKAAQALMESYAALASGVLIGMSEGLAKGKAGSADKPAPARKR